MNTTLPCGVEPNFSDPHFADHLVALPAPAAAGQRFTVTPMSNASPTTREFCLNFGPEVRYYGRAYNPKMDKFFILLASTTGSVAKWVDEDEVFLLQDLGSEYEMESGY